MPKIDIMHIIEKQLNIEFPFIKKKNSIGVFISIELSLIIIGRIQIT